MNEVTVILQAGNAQISRNKKIFIENTGHKIITITAVDVKQGKAVDITINKSDIPEWVNI